MRALTPLKFKSARNGDYSNNEALAREGIDTRLRVHAAQQGMPCNNEALAREGIDTLALELANNLEFLL